jgi:hypothetical protein
MAATGLGASGVQLLMTASRVALIAAIFETKKWLNLSTTAAKQPG